jgi:hypothetical protein
MYLLPSSEEVSQVIEALVLLTVRTEGCFEAACGKRAAVRREVTVRAKNRKEGDESIRGLS